MDSWLAQDLARLPELLQAARDVAARELGRIGDRPVAAPPDGAAARPILPEPAPLEGVGAQAALARFLERWGPGFSASAGPRYLGFVVGGATPAALAGDWLAGAYDQNAASDVGSAATALERETLGWLREALGLGEAHGGAFVTGAAMSNTVGLAIAREWVGERRGVSVTRQGVAALGPVTVLSGRPHSSVVKALSVLGLGRDALHVVPVLPHDAGDNPREAVDVAALEAALAELAERDRPAVVVANAGTVDTGDFDDLRAVAALKERYDFWLHVDGAFGGMAALSPSHAHLVAGLDAADSVCVDLHKWLNVPYDAAVQFTRRRDLQARVFRNEAAYLGSEPRQREADGTAPGGPAQGGPAPGPVADPVAPDPEPEFVHLTPENSRRLRALAAWFTLTAYGRAGHAEIVERCVALARELGRGVAAVPHLRLLAPVRLNVVCFTLAGEPTREQVDAAARAVAASGETFLSPTVFAGRPALRAAFSNWRTTEADVARVLAAVTEATRPPGGGPAGTRTRTSP